MNTKKNFVFKINKTIRPKFLSKLKKNKTHPAFLLLQEYKNTLSQLECKTFESFFKLWSFKDPYKGQGGFGCSGAEFLATYFAIEIYKILSKQKKMTKANLKKQLQNLINKEKKQTKVFFKFKQLSQWGSGFDVLSQLFGSLVWLENKNNFIAKTVLWPFKDYQFSILKSASKLDTQKHLSVLSDQKITIVAKQLQPVVQKALLAIKKVNIQNFFIAVKQQQNILETASLVCPQSIKKNKTLKQITDILASKSCGALGADSFLIFYSTKHKTLIKNKIKTSKSLSSLLWVKDSTLTKGLSFKVY